MKKIIFFLLFTTLTCITVNAQESWESLDQGTYSIKYPSNWKADTSKSIGADLILYSLQNSANDNFTENINVLIQDLSAYDIDLDKYTEISLEQIKSMVQGVKIIESKRISNGSEPYHRVIYLGEQNEYKLKLVQHFYVKDEKAYVLTLTCEQDQFDNYIAIGQKVFNSFQFK